MTLISHPVISIIVATNNYKRIKKFLSTLDKQTKNKKNVEVLILLDHDNKKLEKEIQTLKQSYTIIIKCIGFEHPLGYFSLQYGYNHIFHHHLDPNSYFITVWSDTIAPASDIWDTNLLSYVNTFEDDVFRVCISHTRGIKNPYSMKSQMMNPENFGFYTTQYIKQLGGLGPLWGIDSWLEVCVNLICLLNPHYLERTIYCDTIPIAPYGYDERGQRDIRMIGWSFNNLTLSPIFLSIVYNHAVYFLSYHNYKKPIKSPFYISSKFLKNPIMKNFIFSKQGFLFDLNIVFGQNVIIKLLSKFLSFLYFFPIRWVFFLANIIQMTIPINRDKNYIDQMIVYNYYLFTFQDKQLIHEKRK